MLHLERGGVKDELLSTGKARFINEHLKGERTGPASPASFENTSAVESR